MNESSRISCSSASMLQPMACKYHNVMAMGRHGKTGLVVHQKRWVLAVITSPTKSGPEPLSAVGRPVSVRCPLSVGEIKSIVNQAASRFKSPASPRPRWPLIKPRAIAAQAAARLDEAKRHVMRTTRMVADSSLWTTLFSSSLHAPGRALTLRVHSTN